MTTEFVSMPEPEEDRPVVYQTIADVPRESHFLHCSPQAQLTPNTLEICGPGGTRLLTLRDNKLSLNEAVEPRELARQFVLMVDLMLADATGRQTAIREFHEANCPTVRV